jgi:hypothetical protein
MNKLLQPGLLILFFFFIKFIEIQAQSVSCGTTITAGQKTMESTIVIPEGTATESLPQLNRTLAVSVFIIKNDQNLQGVSSAEIQSAISNLNSFFQPVSLSFKICNTTLIDNYQLDNISALMNEDELVSQYFEKNTINLYIATKISDSYGMDVCGYTHMPSEGKNSIFVQKTCIAGTTLAHQMGHFLNLYHTHEITFGKELADHSDCSLTGDKCCDTEADPGLNGQVDNSCQYTGNLKDSGGTFYQPKTKNMMSFSTDACRCNFSRTQFLRMMYTLKNIKKDLR